MEKRKRDDLTLIVAFVLVIGVILGGAVFVWLESSSVKDRLQVVETDSENLSDMAVKSSFAEMQVMSTGTLTQNEQTVIQRAKRQPDGAVRVDRRTLMHINTDLLNTEQRYLILANGSNTLVTLQNSPSPERMTEIFVMQMIGIVSVLVVAISYFYVSNRGDAEAEFFMDIPECIGSVVVFGTVFAFLTFIIDSSVYIFA